MLLCRGSQVFLRGLEVLNQRLDRWTCAVTVFLMAALTGIVWLQVFQRYIMNASLSWSEELSRYLLVWISFLGASVAGRRGENLSIELVRDRLGPRTRRTVVAVAEGFVLIFWLFIGYYGLRYAFQNLAQMSASLPISYGHVYFGIPVGASLMGLQALEKLVQSLRNGSR
jgi:TRAP-type C4-dicarboxylate transport system permease small subunit